MSLYIIDDSYQRNKKNSIIAFVFILSLCSFLLVNSQSMVTTNELLSNKIEVPGNALLKNNIKFLRGPSQGMPLIDKMELRTETDDFDIIKQEIVYRVSFNNNRTRKIQDKLTNNRIHLYEMKSDIIEEAKIVDRYELIYKWYFIQYEIEHYNTERTFLADEKTVQQKILSNSLLVDVNELLKIEKELSDLDRKLMQLNLKKENLVLELGEQLPVDSDIVLNSDNWISLEKMALVIDGVKEFPNYNFAQVLQESRINEKQLEFDIEESDSKKILDFVQLKYNGRDQFDFQKQVSLGVGIAIPTKAGARVKLNEAKLDIFDEQYKKVVLDAKLEDKVIDYYRNFNTLMKEHAFVSKQIIDNDLSGTMSNYQKSGEVHPLTLLRMKNYILKNNYELKKIEKDACNVYLQILETKGLLSQSPYINYLSEDLDSYNLN